MDTLVVQGRGGGKTQKLLRWAADRNALIVVADERRADELVRRAQDMGIEIRRPVTPSRAYMVRGIGGPRGDVKIAVDDMDDVLAAIFHAPIAYGTVSAGVLDTGPVREGSVPG